MIDWVLILILIVLFIIVVPKLLKMYNIELYSKFVWSKGYNLISDKNNTITMVFPPFNLNDYKNIKNNDIVYVRPEHLKVFINEIFLKLASDISIILITGDSDATIPNDIWKITEPNDPLKDLKYDNIEEPTVPFSEFLKDPRLKHWFSQNLNHVYASDKLSCIPIGVDYHTSNIQKGEAHATQETILNKIKKSLPPINKRPLKVYANFHLSNTSTRFKNIYNGDRLDIYNKLKNNSNIYFEPSYIDRTQFWEKMSDYSFSISPLGNGLDCHRTWELLILGVIPILQSSVLDPLFENLPVIIIKDWNDITEINLKKWKTEILSNKSKYEDKIYTDYWIQKINKIRNT